jgi:hypothetical protein
LYTVYREELTGWTIRAESYASVDNRPLTPAGAPKYSVLVAVSRLIATRLDTLTAKLSKPFTLSDSSDNGAAVLY